VAGTDGAVSTAAMLEGFVRVAVTEVDAALSARFAQHASPDRNFARASSLNLLVHIERTDEAPAVSRVVGKLARIHPIRAVQLIIDGDRSDSTVQAWVKCDCSDPNDPVQLCSEEIVLTSGRDSAERLVSSVRSVLGSDLPTVLWWRGGSPFLVRLFKGLAPLADKIVVDSIRFGNGPAAIDTLRRLAEYEDGSFALADLNWERTASWRSTLAACFDDLAVRELLPDFDRCEIEFSAGEGRRHTPASARSLLLAGWMLSRWPVIAGRGDIAGRQAWAAPGAIIGLALTSSKTGARIAIRWERQDAGIVADAFDRAGNAIRDWHFAPDPEDEGDLLQRCTESIARDALLDAALTID
jgi:glucose-6-phosphate dehydrogenase assembly protein OpcA